MLRKLFQAMRRGETKRRRRFAPTLLSLEARDVPAVIATFSNGVLSVTGDEFDNTIEISRNAAGSIHVNDGAVAIRGGKPTVANTRLIQVFGQGGNDFISLNETNGALPAANLFGGAGNDTLIGGSGNDLLFGQSGNDILFGMGGSDFLFGGTEDDVLTGGAGNDQVFGESGNDRMVWNPGDGTDLNEGGSGIDTVEVNGGNGAEQFTTTANGTRVRFDRISPAPFSIDIGTTENLVLNANGGDDFFSATGNLAALIQIAVDGGAGNDTILGSNGADLLIGGDGNDFIDGQQGNDVILLGAGDDTFNWDPGDGSDVVEGQGGFDTMIFNGSNANEIFHASANGRRLQFSRNVGNIVMDLNDIERVNLNALGGADTIVIDSLARTKLVEFNVNLAGTLGAVAGDSQPDTVIVNGTEGNDIIDIFGGGTTATVVGLSTLVTIANTEGANDSLVINALGGNDGVTAVTMPAGVMKLTIDGGAGNDTLLGSQGADVILGGSGNDFIDGRQGDDLVLMGDGNDVFQWNPGDGSDTVEGQAGDDILKFFGSNASEAIDIFANGDRVRLFRNVANVNIDFDDVEKIELRAFGGADTFVVGDLTGTDTIEVSIDLRGPDGGGDGAADSITVNGTQGNDTFGVAGDAGGIVVFGLHSVVKLFHQEQANDRLTLNGLGGGDIIDASSLEADGIQLTINGGLGNDVLIGSSGNDVITGGDGNDLMIGGDGDDTFIWNPGDDNDAIEGQGGNDRLVFNGANVSENFDISAVDNRVRFFRNVANVTLDINGIDVIDINALGGADTITVNDLTGTDVVEVNVNLAGSNGSGDAQPDTVIVNGTNNDDVIILNGNASGVSVIGLFTTVNIFGAEVANDRVIINALGGDDVVDASGLTADSISLVANGGEGNDVLIGGDGNDILDGGPGEDVLIGGPGIDILANGEIVIP